MTALRQPGTCVAQVNGINLAYYDWPSSIGSEGTPPMVIAHATGFHGRCYDALIEQFPDRRVVAVDLRGHGRSEGEPVKHWQQFADDVSALLAKLKIKGALGIGHSMGAHTILQSAADYPDLYSKLVLFDPVILAPEFYEPDAEWFNSENSHPSIRRKRDFSSPEAMMERFANRDPYSLFEPRVFEDYCRHGLSATSSGDYELACSPEMESSVYMSSRSNSRIHDAASTVDIPVLVVRAQRAKKMDFKGSPTWPELATLMPKGKDLHRPDRTHFHPFEASADAAQIIADFAD